MGLDPAEFEKYRRLYASPLIANVLSETHPKKIMPLENVKITLEQQCELRRTKYGSVDGDIYHRDFQGTIVRDFSDLDASDGVISQIMATKPFKDFISEKTISLPETISFDTYPFANVKLTATQVKGLIEKGCEDFRGAVITGQAFVGINVQRCDFTDAYLRGSDFTDCDVTVAKSFLRANIRDCVFNTPNGVLPEVLERVSNKLGAVFSDLTNIDTDIRLLYPGSSSEKSLEGVKLSLAQFTSLVKDGRKNFVGVVLAGLDFSVMAKGELAFQDLDLRCACLDGCRFMDFDSEQSFKQMLKQLEEEEDVELRGNLDSQRIKLNNLDMEGASLVEANFNGTEMTNVNMNRADGERATFEGAKVEDLGLDRANLKCTRLNMAGTYTATFFASIAGANLSGCQLEIPKEKPKDDSRPPSPPHGAPKG